MTILIWFIIFILGLSLINIFAYNLNIFLKIGLSFPIGLGFNSIVMFIIDIIGLPVNNYNLIIIVDLIILLICNLYTYFKILPERKIKFPTKYFNLKNLTPINLAWLLIIGYSLYVGYAIVSKSLFWPVFIFDSVDGYDFLAKVIFHEGTLNNSIFNKEYPLYSYRSLYPPLVPYNFSFAYMIGHSSSKIICVFYYISLFITFYSILKKYNTHLSSAFFTFLLIITPEFAAFSALSSPNPILTYYSSIGLLLIYIWFKENNKQYFYIGTILLIFALWTRTEALIFIIPAGLITLLYTIKNKKFAPIIVLSLSSLITFIVWSIYTNYILKVDANPQVIKYIYWDFEKLLRMLKQVKEVSFNTTYYGIIIYLFLFIIMINFIHIIKKKDMILFLSIIFIPWILYLIIYYQINVDYTPENNGSFITAGYKRGLFYFLPLIVYYIANNKIVNLLFNKYLLISPKKTD